MNPTVPDFDRLHAEFASDLDRVKRSKELTRVKEFDITKSKPKAIAHDQPKLFKAKPYIPPPAPEDQPTTEKTKQMIAKTQERLKERERKQAEAERVREERLKQNPEMQSKLIPKIVATHAHGSATTDETIRELTKRAKKGQKHERDITSLWHECFLLTMSSSHTSRCFSFSPPFFFIPLTDMQEKDAAWAARVNEMKSRVRNRPLLVESYNSTAGRIEARKKALLAIKESLDKAGIKDQAKFFDPQELADLDLKF